MENPAVANAVYWLGWLSLLSKIAAGLVAAGVVLEFAEGWLASGLQKTVDDARVVQIASLQNDTAKANERAQRSEAARVAMLMELQPRDLKPDQMDSLAAALRGHFKEIYIAGLSDPEAMQFSFAIAEGVRRSGATSLLFLDASKGSPARYWREFEVPVASNGVTVYANKDDMPIIMEALVKAKVANVGGVPSPNQQFKGVPTPTIFVGLKPQPFSQFPAYAAPPELQEWQKKHPPAWNPN